jgi:hypothetical protein
VAVLAVVAACQPIDPIPPPPDAQGSTRPRGDTAGDRRRNDIHENKLTPVTIYLASLPWGIPEYHDEQRLWDATTAQYGPMANVYVQPYWGSFYHIGQINAHGDSTVLAAVIWVDPPTPPANLPKVYTDLGLKPELNCLYLRHTLGNPMQGWTGLMVPGSTVTGCPRPTPPASPTVLPVRALNLGFTRFEDYPAVARFEELGGRTLIGLKCLTAWCQIGPNTPPEVAPHLSAPGAPTTRAWRVNGWYDDQTIAAKNQAGAVVARIRASVVPVENLETLTTAEFAAGWVQVATVWMSATPPVGSLYQQDWKLERGLNKLYLRYDPTKPPTGQWRAALRGPNGNWTNDDIPVERHAHYDLLVPGTARWRFVSTDEIIWVRCDQGCCQVDATSIM